MNNPYAVGILAGIASGFLLVGASYAGIFSPLLFLASPLPIYLAVLAWGTYGGVAASVTAILLLGVISSPQAAILVAALITIPAMMIGHQANLGQPDEDQPSGMLWYPLDRLLFNMANIIAIGFILVGAIVGFNIEAMVPETVEFMKSIGRDNPQLLQAQNVDMNALAKFYLELIPFMLPASWLIVHVINMHLAVKIARHSGRMPRPADDLPAQTSLPRIALIALPTTMVLMLFTSGAISHVFAVFAGVLFMAFALVGLARLHHRARNNPGLRLVVFFTYILIVLFAVPLVLFAIIGLFHAAAQSGNQNTTHSNE